MHPFYPTAYSVLKQERQQAEERDSTGADPVLLYSPPLHDSQ